MSALEPDYDSDHSDAWKRKNLEEIENDDDEIKMLERKLGIRTDDKRKKRFQNRIEQEGLGLGIFDFLEGIEKNAKLDRSHYLKPEAEFKFNDPRFETAIGDSDLEDGDLKKSAKKRADAGSGEDQSSSDQEGFDQDGLELDAPEDFEDPYGEENGEEEEDYDDEEGMESESGGEEGESEQSESS